jgi:Ca2+-binding EF-hand superfamily protein
MLMQRILFVAFLTTSIFAGIGVDAAQKPAKTSENAQSGAHRTIVFFGSESPIFLQMHLLVDGRNFDEWFASFLFQAVDTNRDGAITKMEMDAVPPDLLGRVAGGALMNAEDGLSAEQLRQTLTSHADELFAIEARRQAQSQAVQLLPKLDRNGDGHLDRDELASGTETLARRDLDDDETFSASELLPFNDPLNRTAVVMTQTADLPFAHVTVETTPAIVDRIMKRYGPVSIATEMLNDDETAQRIDANSDGRLEKSEIAKLLADPPNHVFVTINVPGRTFPRTRVSITVAPSIAKSVTVKDANAGKKQLVIEGVPIEFEARGGSRTNRMDHRQMIMVRYSSADKDKNRYLDEDEYNAFVGMVGQYGFGADFKAVDADSDGMVLRTEIKGHIERDAMLSQCRLVMRVASKARSLFQLLDANIDNRLSRREFRTGFGKVAGLDVNKDGRIGDNELASEFQLSFALGRPITFTSQANQAAPMNSADGRVPNISDLNGPRWFVRMDRNRDGDVSSREFLGTAEMFQQVDSDADGLIGLTEANAVGAPAQ